MNEFSTPRPARTDLLRSLQKAFGLAVAAEQPGAPTVAELVEQAEDHSRRRFLATGAKFGVLAGATGLLAACETVAVEPAADLTAFKASNAQGGAARVVVVGAGMAGLNCAYKLQRGGITASIYEAGSRVGGRIFTAKNLMGAGLTTELGGEFIDSGHIDMLNLAQEFGLPLLDVEAPSETALIKDTYFLNNRRYSLQEVIQAFQPYVARITDDVRAMPNTIVFDNYGAAGPFDQLSISGYFDSIGMVGMIRTLLEVAYVTEYGLEANQQTAINFLWMFSPDTRKGTFDIFGISDERYKIQGGNQRLTDALAQRLAGQITLQHKLTAITKPADEYILTFQQPSGSTVTVTADVVVLTIPFTVLRQVALNLPLPAWKTNAINNLGYGTNAKLFLGFNSRPWRTNGYTGYLFTDQAAQGGWDGSQLQPGTAGAYTVFVGGQVGVDMGTGSPHSQVSRFLPTLEAAWPGTQAQYNGKVERFHWPSHPLTLASYACYRPGQYTTIAGAEGRPVGNLFFAGEHCSAYFQGYMNGAAETGRLAAQAILQAATTKKVALVSRLRQALMPA
ncbi:flavin monoamine oxidase family protein [Hymenobacter properus]|uniref:NAD(P)/FAD-dependent oxidoreductase n=1 Tax=Hymenobacter properus TaxID=2791026 RepID=A0A931BHZ4_9BACT|nr:NAD(P)/FAD-dependent oxidoreductase [Hymenobacter properus]MBF9142836.1 NAD(P)/FAD-dependent oxidoreductase [Hymenobacter properus]MBR7721645.1 NAD(P)/FAD-dependent oxidoreductase [Microvirga sp. SRT04]